MVLPCSGRDCVNFVATCIMDRRRKHRGSEAVRPITFFAKKSRLGRFSLNSTAGIVNSKKHDA